MLERRKVKLKQNYFLKNDVVELARDLIGKVIVTRIDNDYAAAVISETEAYAGVVDKASHAYNNRFTKRTKTMYEKGGIAYVYLCYGIHSLFNIVTNTKGIPHAVLVRSAIPLDGVPLMYKRRKRKCPLSKLASGPGSFSLAMGINLSHNRISLTGNVIWIEDRGIKINKNELIAGPRIGVDYAGEDAKLPYRFSLKVKR